jgi:hypothetical protein
MNPWPDAFTRTKGFVTAAHDQLAPAADLERLRGLGYDAVAGVATPGPEGCYLTLVYARGSDARLANALPQLRLLALAAVTVSRV